MVPGFERKVQAEVAEKYFMDVNNDIDISSNIKNREELIIKKFSEFLSSEIPSENIVCSNIVIHERLRKSVYAIDLVFSGISQNFSAEELDYLINDYVISLDPIPVGVIQEIGNTPFTTRWKIGVDVYNIKLSSSESTYATFSATLALDIMEDMS